MPGGVLTAAIIECVPNFSEGRRKDVVDKIVHSIRSVPGTKVLDVESDADHNRSVITFVGSKESVHESAFRGARAAAELIDLTKHTGEHPRMGALDVLPFIPISGATMEDCIEVANRTAARIWKSLKVPCYMYEAAAKRPERRNLENVRRGQFEGLREAVLTDDSRYPDYGSKGLHPTAGATAVGARMPLIAFNVNLDSTDVEAAKAIAKKIRASSGGMPHVKALGFTLKEKNMVQVSMNLTDYTVTPISKVFDAVRAEADSLGVKVANGEIIGLIPLDSVCDLAASFLKLDGFTSKQVLERRIWA
ncbi:MAG: glutamate formimidoyltransferase [Thermoplasmata archaeon]|nr:glutamate formimidoyltransferase [Thermoplasmata archaeon]